MKLNKVELINFKCFANHIINFNETTILIGENNSGKSTVVEALRVLGLACARLQTATVYSNRPEWLKDIKSLATKGVNISSRAIDVELESVFNRYNIPPAIIKANFDNNLFIEIYINSEVEIFAIISLSNIVLTSKAKTIQASIPNVCVLPQIVPLRKKEELVSEETLNRNKFSKRTSGNFRNSLLSKKGSKLFAQFEALIEKTWGEIKINELSRENNLIVLQLRDRDFATEIFNMGHGVQMWLQTMWFITCAGENSIVVLDEPDVYMHADLQRKLIRLLKNQYNQTIIATHSIEIMAEVQPCNILIVNRKKEESIFADNYPVLQTAISSMGSIHNISLSRILNNKKYLFVEGNDKEILNILYDGLFPDITTPLDHISSVSTGGWGSWDVQKNTAKSLMSELKGLKIYFLYDRDYHTEEDISVRKIDARNNQIYLHIWNKKEIENYLIVPVAIARLIRKKNHLITSLQLTEEIIKLIEEICEDMKENTLDNFIDEASKKVQHKKAYSTIKSEMRPNFEIKWRTFDNKIGLVSGKILISRLSDKCKTVYGVSFGNNQIASNMTNSDIAEEIKTFLTAIKDGVNIY